jgi:phage baseplate assembly protein W
MAEIPHMAFPFARGSVVEQDTEAHIMSCENVIVRCDLGFREDRPEFGWPFPTFQNNPLNLEPLRTALARFEPRGNADISQWADEAELAVQHIEILVGVA